MSFSALSHSSLLSPHDALQYWASLDLLWGQLRVSSGLAHVCSCLCSPQLTESVTFPLWELSLSIYILHRHRVDLICTLYSL